jgi:hypothetical protein
MDHYRCYHIFIIKTKAERDSDTVTFSPSKTKMPALSSTDRTIRAANELVHALRHPHPLIVPIGTEQLKALEQLSENVGSTTPPPTRTNASKSHAMQTRQETTPTQNPQTVPRVAQVINQATLQPPKAPEPPPSLTQLKKDIHDIVNSPPMPIAPLDWTNFTTGPMQSFIPIQASPWNIANSSNTQTQPPTG